MTKERHISRIVRISLALLQEAMRRILIDRARRRQAIIHGGGVEHCNVEEIDIVASMKNDDELLEVHEALDKLAAMEPRKAEVVKLRFFVGLRIDECDSSNSEWLRMIQPEENNGDTLTIHLDIMKDRFAPCRNP